MTNKVAYIMIGLPASGKSTIINNHILKKVPNAEIISSDHFIQRFADLKDKSYNDVFTEVADTANAMMWNRANRLAEAGKTLIVDRTSIDKETREVFVDFLIEHKYMVFAICFEPDDTNIKTILERNAAREKEGKNIPEEIIMSMYDRYERPVREEGFSAITFIDIDGE